MPQARTDEPLSRLPLPSLAEVYARGFDPRQFEFDVAEALETLGETIAYEVTNRAFAGVLEAYRRDFDAYPDTTRLSVFMDLAAPGVPGRPRPLGWLIGASGYRLHSNLTAPTVDRVFGMQPPVSVGLSRLWASFPSGIESSGTVSERLATLLVRAAGSLIEAEGYTPARFTLVALPLPDESRWVRRYDEVLQSFFEVVDPRLAGALDVGVAVEPASVRELILAAMGEDPSIRQARLVAAISLSVAAQLLVQEGPGRLRIYASYDEHEQELMRPDDIVVRLAGRVGDYLENFIQTFKINRALSRSLITDIENARDSSLGSRRQYYLASLADMVRAINPRSTVNSIADAAAAPIRILGIYTDLFYRDGAHHYDWLYDWWAAVRNRLSFRQGEIETTGMWY